MRNLTLSLIGVAAVAAGLILVRTRRTTGSESRSPETGPVDTDPRGALFLERLRELGI